MNSEWKNLLCIGSLGGLLVLIALRHVLDLIGFTSQGVRRDSWASRWHRYRGRIRAGSLFSFCQRCASNNLLCDSKCLVFVCGFFITVIIIDRYIFKIVPSVPKRNLT